MRSFLSAVALGDAMRLPHGLILVVLLVLAPRGAGIAATWGQVTPIADTAHPNLLYNQTEITAYRTQLLTNHTPAALWSAYVSQNVSTITAIPTTGLSQTDLNEPWTTNYWAAFSYMMEPTLAKAQAIRTMLLSFPSVFPAGHALDGDDWWQSHGWGFSAVPTAWCFDLILAYHPTVLSTGEISQLKAWFTLAAAPQGADHFVDEAGAVITHEGKTIGEYANWWSHYVGNNLPFALVSGNQAAVDYWADSGWPQTRFTYDGSNPPPSTANRFDLVMNILAIFPSGANADSYNREGFGEGGSLTAWRTVNEGNYHFFYFGSLALSAEMAYHNGMTGVYSGVPGAQLLHTYQLALQTTTHTDATFGPEQGHPILYNYPFIWTANRHFSGDAVVAAGLPGLIDAGNNWVSIAPRGLYPFLGWPVTGPVVGGLPAPTKLRLLSVTNP